MDRLSAACQYIIDLSPEGAAPPGRDLVGGLLADEVAALVKGLPVTHSFREARLRGGWKTSGMRGPSSQ